MVDARGLLCPMPVVMVQKAVKDGHPAEIEVLLDDACAVENVTRYANRQGYTVTSAPEGSDTRLNAEEMTAYIATFHTHLSALLTCRALTAAGVAAQMMPVPRRLSAAAAPACAIRPIPPCSHAWTRIMRPCMRRRITPPRVCCVKTDKNTPGAEQLRESLFM